MKRRIFVTVVILVVVALVFIGNPLAGRILDAKLGPLLADNLGLPVQLAPMRAHLLQLTAESDTLVMGNTGDPAVVATNVKVSLVLSALLRGEIRLQHASADNVMIRPSRWPSSDTPAPSDYRFLDPWLPADLQAATARYVSAAGEDYAVNGFHWQRNLLSGASARWWEQREAGEVTLDAELKSLKDLLLLAPVEIDITMEVMGKPDSQVSLTTNIQPSKTAAYSLLAEFRTADMSAQVNASGQEKWSLPDRSNTTIALLKIGQMFTLVDAYSDSDPSKPTAEVLASKVPLLSLPAHQGSVVINEVRLMNEVNTDTSFVVISNEQGVQIDSLSSTGPTGILTGELAVKSGPQGWAVTADATMQERTINAGVGSKYMGTDWLWNNGHATLDGSGDTWATLLNSLTGDLSLAGHYNNKQAMPVSIDARLDNASGELSLDHLMIVLGQGQITGSASLSENEPHTLTMNLEANNLDLDFLVVDGRGETQPGVAIPEYLNIFPDINMNISLLAKGLEAPGVHLIESKTTLQRNAEGGTLSATGSGRNGGTFKLNLAAANKTGEVADFRLNAVFNRLDLSSAFRQPGANISRTSGKMSFEGSGKGISEVFKALHGDAELSLELRADNNWQRPSATAEKILLSGEAYILTDSDRIVGVKVDRIRVDSFDQDLTGDISILSSHNPWLTADLQSKKLNVSTLRKLIPQHADDADASDLLSSLNNLGQTQLSLNVESLIFDDIALSNVLLEASSDTDLFDIKALNFNSHNGTAKSQGKVTWEGLQATLEATADLSDIDLDQFLIQGMEDQHVPVSGSAKVTSQGGNIGELVSSMSGYVDLQATEPQQGESLQTRRKLEMKATRLLDGMHAEITTLQWGASDLSGSIVYRRTTPRLLNVNIHSSALSLLPWENAEISAKAKTHKAKTQETKTQETKIPEKLDSAINTTSEFVGDILLSPLRFLSDKSEEGDTPSAKLFSAEPLSIAATKNLKLRVDVELDSLESNVISARALSLKGSLTDGKWLIKANLGQASGGIAEATVNLDINTVPASLNFTSNFKNMRGLADQNTYPRSGFISIKSQGGSEAELAASTNGLLYIELGKGPFDYSSSALFTADLVSSIFTTLIPGIEREEPEVECGVVLALFKDGKGITPYGFALRTNDANLLGNIQVDLGKETMDMSLDSRGRQGVGISVGSVFSNTVDIKGPLADPSIVPNAASILVRGWAAVMTAGLSVLGESMVKRILASENPCPPINEHIVKDLCPKNALAASSEMVCPKT
ncbi:MAG: hypothetical protein ACKVHM_03860 [Pseudomonadales bacterium]